MPTMGYPLEAFLVVDNNVLVSLCEYYCDSFRNLPFPEMVQAVCGEVSNVFTKLRSFALENKLLTTDCVQDEFKPENGPIARYRGFSLGDCNYLKSHIQNEVEAHSVNMRIVDRLRSLTQAPSRFGERLGRLSDQDLSLVILALGISHKFRERVYILTDEEDLRSFVSWMKSRPDIKTVCSCPQQIEAIHSLTYIDSAHRYCTFPTEYILQLFGYLTMNQLNRSMLEGTTKGGMISLSYRRFYDDILLSREAKLEHAARGANL